MSTAEHLLYGDLQVCINMLDLINAMSIPVSGLFASHVRIGELCKGLFCQECWPLLMMKLL